MVLNNVGDLEVETGFDTDTMNWVRLGVNNVEADDCRAIYDGTKWKVVMTRCTNPYV